VGEFPIVRAVRMAADLEQLEEDLELARYLIIRPEKYYWFKLLQCCHRRSLVISACKRKISLAKSKSTTYLWKQDIDKKVKKGEKLKARIFFEDLDAELAKKMAKLLEKFNFSVKKTN